MKRIFDIAFSLLFLLLFLPLFLIIAVLIKITSRGSIFFIQERIGRGGIPFRCYKFRTMCQDAEKKLIMILEKNPKLKNEWDATYKLKNDPRITSIGKFLRKISLDEFPQFFNILCGEMSVVGPRPMVHEEILDHLGRKAYKILSIKPGLTGLWQVYGRSDTSYEKRIELDERYVNKHSIWLDFKIICLTFRQMISPKGAY